MRACRCLLIGAAAWVFAPRVAVAQAQQEEAAAPTPVPAVPSPPLAAPASTAPAAPSASAAPLSPVPAAPAPPAPAPAAPAAAPQEQLPASPGASATAPTSSVSPELAAATAGGLNYERETTWDLNLEGGYGRFFSDPAKNTGFVRARAGVLFIRNSTYRALGLTYEYSALSPAAFGVQGEVLNLELGLWTQLGGFVDVSGHFGAQLAAGWSLFGVEGQYRAVEDRGSAFALFGKLRLPISIIARALK